MKKRSIFLLLLGTLYTINSNSSHLIDMRHVFLGDFKYSQEELSPENLIVVHDLHEVAVDPVPGRVPDHMAQAVDNLSVSEKVVGAGTILGTLGGAIGAGVCAGAKMSSWYTAVPVGLGAGLLTATGLALAATSLYFSPTLVYKDLQLTFKKASGEAHERLFRKYGCNRMADMSIAIRNSYTVNQPYVEHILQVFDQAGFDQVYATNGGSEAIKQLREFPENAAVFDILEKGKSVAFVNPDGSENESPAEKPGAQYYDELEQEFNPEGNKILVLIDNNRKNVEKFVCKPDGTHYKRRIGIWYERTKQGQQFDTDNLVHIMDHAFRWSVSPFKSEIN